MHRESDFLIIFIHQ